MPQTAEAVATDLEFDEMTTTRDTRIEALATEWNLSFDLDPQFPVAKVKHLQEIQVREEHHRAPTDTVEQYSTHMRHGANFPPIVLMTNGALVDGNARLAACQKINRKTFPAYKVKFLDLAQAMMFGAALNQLGGDRLTEAEIVTAAEAYMRAGYTDEAIARTLGRSVTHIRNVRRERVYKEAAARIGVADLAMSRHAQRALSGISHDEPLKLAVELVAKHKPAPRDIADLVTRIENTRSDAEAIAAINAVSEKWGPVSGPPPGRPSATKSHSKKALKLVRALVELAEPDPKAVVLDNDTTAAAWWNRLVTVANQVAALYVKHD